MLSPKISEHHPLVEQSIKKIFKEFEKDYYRYNLQKINLSEKIKIVLTSGIPNIIAHCDNNQLTVNVKEWDSFERKKHLIYHELGHCIFDFAHQKTGIMSYKWNLMNESADIKDLFTLDLMTNTELYH